MKFEDINLVPREISTINSREDCDTSTEFLGQKVWLPIIPAPMKDVIGSTMAQNLLDTTNRIYFYHHRFCTIEEQAHKFNGYGGCAIGVDENLDRFKALYDIGCRSFLIDTANGASIKVLNRVDNILKHDSSCYITIGNIISREVTKTLYLHGGIDAVRIFIGSGAACATTDLTGIHHDPVDCILECRDNGLLIIADGGIDTPDKFIKAIAIGADMVMCGKLFAKCADSDAENSPVDSKEILYRGSASGYFNESKYKEGYATHQKKIPYRSDEVVDFFIKALQSAMSYLNARNLIEFRENVNVENFIRGNSNTSVARTDLWSKQICPHNWSQVFQVKQFDKLPRPM